MTKDENKIYHDKIVESLLEIRSLCDSLSDDPSEMTREEHDELKSEVRKNEKRFVEMLDEYRKIGKIDTEHHNAYLQILLGVTYEFYKKANSLSFGTIVQPEEMPLDSANANEVELLDAGNVVKSFNQVRKGRIKKSGDLVFCKNTDPETTQLEIVAAQFYKHTLDGRTSRGKVVVEDGKMKGMYVKAIPGFVSMRQLTDLAKRDDALVELDSRINKLKKEIGEIEEKIEKAKKNNWDTTYLVAKLNEKNNFLGTYTQVKELELIDPRTKLVNVNRIAKIVARSLCTSFFCEDYDRHKDNLGLSFQDGELGAASLDYDRSLSGILGMDWGCYDWNLTPQFLESFPQFQCRYWPSSSNWIRSILATIFFAREKTAKMYEDLEARRYLDLRENKDFQHQSQVEWLKLVFIPEEIRQLAVDKMASKSCDPQLRAVPARLEEKKKQLLNSLVQTNRFRKSFIEDLALLDEVKKELKSNLEPEEFKIVELNWSIVELEIQNKIKAVQNLEEMARSVGHNQLFEAIKRRGVSFDSSIDNVEFARVLSSINTTQATWKIQEVLNKGFGLNLSVHDARKIKEEMYVEKISKVIPDLKDILEGILFDNETRVRSTKRRFVFFRVGTNKAIEGLAESVEEYEMADEDNKENCIKKVMKSLRKLGVTSEVISEEELRGVLEGQREVKVLGRMN